jgi:ATP-dependent metalloprotease FtsH
VDRTGRQVNIRLRNLRLSRAVAAEDAGEILEDVERPTARFSDVFGAEAAKEALQFVVDWLQNPRHYAALGVSPPRGILMTGPPGTGKTFLARALAGESDVSFLVASGTDFVTIWQGSGPQNIRDLFDRARRYAPSILFIDEIDAIGKKRMGTGGAGRAEESTLNALLTEMDGFGAPTLRPVIILAATNLVDHLDDALQRRFDRIVEVPPPDRDARLAYLRKELMGRDLSQVTEPVVKSLAGRSTGMTIANLRRIVNEAAVMAARSGSPLTDAIVEEAFEKMRMGEAHEAPDALTLERIARHEAGHALIGWRTGSRPVQVTIVGRGGAGGYVEKEVDEDKIIYTRAELENLICQAMGGRAAELIYYGEADGLSTGVGSDLKNASGWAERMIREFGMSDEVGQVYLDRRYLQDGPLAVKVSAGVERVVRTQLDRAVTILDEERHALDRLSEELLRRNRLTRADLAAILDGEPPSPPDGPEVLAETL